MLRIITNREFIAGMMLAGFGIAANLLSRNYKMGTAFRMGAAYFPFMLSILLIVIGLVIVLLSLRHETKKVGKIAWRPLIIICATVLLFAVTIKSVGMVPVIFGLTIFSRLSQPVYLWAETLLLGAFLAIFSSVLFYLFLGIQMPLLPVWFE